MRVITADINSLATGTVFSANLPELIPPLVAKVFAITIAQCAGTPTVTLAIKDPNSNTVYSQASIAENTTTVGTDKWIPIVAGGSVTLTFTTAPGVAAHKLVLYCAEWI